MNDTLVSLDDISFSYAPERIVLSECSFLLKRSDRVGLTGPNGSGKTTLLALIVCLVVIPTRTLLALTIWIAASVWGCTNFCLQRITDPCLKDVCVQG